MRTEMNAESPHGANNSPFRDALVGASELRERLLRERRANLAHMPEVHREIYVRRFARICFSFTAIVGGSLTLAAATYDGMWQQLLPGEQPAVVSTLLLTTWLLGAFAFLLGCAFAEGRFTSAMLGCVRAGQDVHKDVERLRVESPESVARSMSQRLESMFAAAPVAALGLLAPLTLSYLSLALVRSGYPDLGYFEEHVSDQADLYIAFAAIGLIFAGAALHTRTRVVARLCWFIVPAFCLLMLPFSDSIGLSYLLISMIVVNIFVARSMKRVRSERVQLEQEDLPSEIGLIGSVLQVSRRSQVFWLVVSFFVIIFCWVHESEPESWVDFAASEATDFEGSLSPLSVVSQDELGMIIEGRISSDWPLHDALGLPAIPVGWHAEIEIELLQLENETELLVTPAVVFSIEPRVISTSHPEARFQRSNCGFDPLPLGIELSPIGAWPAEGSKIMLRYQVSLRLANCHQ